MRNDILEYSGGIRYSGKATLKVSDGKNIIKTIKVHNAGNAPLFKFLAMCLGGDYSGAENLRPTKIKLFSMDEVSASKTITLEQAKGYETDGSLDSHSSQLTGYVGTNTNASAPVVDERSSGTVPSARTSLHFIIPYSFIQDGFLSQIRLYPKNADDTTNNAFAAVFYITNGANLSGITIDNSSNYSLILDWELTIKGEY